jgi:hypothetical protein
MCLIYVKLKCCVLYVNFLEDENPAVHGLTYTIRGASKIKLKNVNKKRMATARRLIFLEFLKASIADLIPLFFSSLHKSEGGGDSDSGNSFADPCQFLPLPRPKILLSASLLHF